MKISQDAKLVHKGVIFDVYQRQQKMFDGTYGTFERVKRCDTVQIIPVFEGKIVICRQTQPDILKPYYSLIGGRNDQNEIPEKCAERELLEETGMKSDEFILWKTYNPQNKIDWNLYFYIAKNCQKIAEQSLDNGEKLELIYLSFEEFIELLQTEDFWSQSFVIDIFKMEKNGKLDGFRNEIFG